MIPVLFKLGPITVYSYGLMMALGFLAADFLLAAECRRRSISPDFASAIVVWGAIAGLAGARLYDVADNFPAYMQDPWSIVFSGSGFVWYGGLFGGVLSTYLVSRHYRVGFLTTTDMCAPALALGQAFGRMGCQVSGDGDWGLPSNLPWAMAYPKAIVGWNANTVLKLDSQGNLVSGFYPGVRVHPAPVYEVILYVAVFLFLWSIRKNNRVEGRLFYLYLILVGASRFLVEFIRINPRVLFGLTEAQLISIGMMVVGTIAYVFTVTSGRSVPVTAESKPQARKAARGV
jgi:phosphatidylglycerol---prolipoprotein diacylglyceryl transferase